MTTATVPSAAEHDRDPGKHVGADRATVTALAEAFARPLHEWLRAPVGPGHGLRLPVRVGGRTWSTEVTLGTPWRQPSGATWRSVRIVVLAGRSPARWMPQVTAEFGVRADGGGLRCHLTEIEGGRWWARGRSRRIGRAVLRRLEAAAAAAAGDERAIPGA